MSVPRLTLTLLLTATALGCAPPAAQTPPRCVGTVTGQVEGSFECKVTVMGGSSLSGSPADFSIGIERFLHAGNMLPDTAQAFSVSFKLNEAFHVGAFTRAEMKPGSAVTATRTSSFETFVVEDYPARDLFAAGELRESATSTVKVGHFALSILDTGREVTSPQTGAAVYEGVRGSLHATLEYAGTLPAPKAEPGAVGSTTVHIEFGEPPPATASTAPTWKLRALVFRNAEHAGQSTTMSVAEVQLAFDAIYEFSSRFADVTGGGFLVDVETVVVGEPLRGMVPTGFENDSTVWPSPAVRTTYPEGTVALDGYFVLWKHANPVIPYQWGGLTNGPSPGVPGHSDIPVDTLLNERNRIYEAFFHEFGHQAESFYGCGNIFDACGRLGYSLCASDATYPDMSWMCCYRELYSGRAPGGCMAPEAVAMKGTPTAPRP